MRSLQDLDTKSRAVVKDALNTPSSACLISNMMFVDDLMNLVFIVCRLEYAQQLMEKDTTSSFGYLNLYAFSKPGRYTNTIAGNIDLIDLLGHTKEHEATATFL